MAKSRDFLVVVASDGSSDGRAAVAAAVAFPWPEGSEGRGVVARPRSASAQWPAAIRAAVDENFDRVAASARRALQRRWPAADVAVLDKTPVEAILAEARGADVVVVGCRGHGALGRLLLGSVSRDVVRRSACSTLVVKGQPRDLRRYVIAVDGSANARRAVEFVAHLQPRGGQVTLVRVLEPMRVGSIGLMPAAVRSRLAGEMAAARGEHTRAAQRELTAGTAALERAGWKVRSAVRWGVPVDEVLAAVRSAGGHVLVMGARGTGGIARLLLGSVAEGALNRSRVPVLLVR